MTAKYDDLHRVWGAKEKRLAFQLAHIRRRLDDALFLDTIHGLAPEPTTASIEVDLTCEQPQDGGGLESPR